ncbi:MAG TPA: amidohydrolase family protein [Dehalococcoidia bacterium]|nr:amidohydrolase family protein [Dehalococcoidia bacterium]
MLRDFLIIDADGHAFENRTLWRDRMDPQWYNTEQGIQFTKDASGQNEIRISGAVFGPGSRRTAMKPFGDPRQYPRGAPAHFDLASRLRDMDEEGIDISVLFPTIGLGVWAMKDPAFAVNFARSYNDWLAEYCAGTDRVYGVAVMPLQDPDAAAAEVERAAGLGYKAVMVNPNRINGRRLDSPDYERFYAAVAATGLRLCVHIGAFMDESASADRWDVWAQRHISCHPFEMMLGFQALITGGVLERHRNLTIAFLESGTGWLPFWMERIEEHIEHFPDDFPKLSRRPIEIFKEQCYISFDPEDHEVPHVAEVVGNDRLFYASDYPHYDAAFPNSARVVLERTDLTDEQKKAFLCDNPARFYGLEALVKARASAPA